MIFSFVWVVVLVSFSFLFHASQALLLLFFWTSFRTQRLTLPNNSYHTEVSVAVKQSSQASLSSFGQTQGGHYIAFTSFPLSIRENKVIFNASIQLCTSCLPRPSLLPPLPPPSSSMSPLFCSVRYERAIVAALHRCRMQRSYWLNSSRQHPSAQNSRIISEEHKQNTNARAEHPRRVSLHMHRRPFK